MLEQYSPSDCHAVMTSDGFPKSLIPTVSQPGMMKQSELFAMETLAFKN